MDTKTLRTYESDAQRLSQLYRSVEPKELYQVLRAFFHPEKPTADIGTGSGRDAAWLHRQGFPVTGYDASGAMLNEARSAYPLIRFQESALPDLHPILDGVYHNVLCAATLMHIPREHLITAAFSLARILATGGRLVLTYRQSTQAHEREEDGRLFTAIPAGKLILLLEAAGLQVVQTYQQADSFRVGITWTVMTAEKSPLLVSRGLERVQSVLAQDKKDATYKFALIRALCAISRHQPHAVQWGRAEVFVPLWTISVYWLTYYWPLLTHQPFIAQKRGEAPGCLKPIAFRREVDELAAQFGAGGLYACLSDLEEHPDRYRGVLKRIADTVRYGPVHYSGTNIAKLFEYERRSSGTTPGIEHKSVGATPEEQLGYVKVPESIWLDISRFGHWIEDSLILRWAQLTAEMNPGSAAGQFLPLLLSSIRDERETATVRTWLTASGKPLYCVWSDASLSAGFEVDHVIPYSAWGNNSLWNLLPALPKVNNQKRDALPSRLLLKERREAIVDYWQLYRARSPESFDRQVSRSLGLVVGQSDWEQVAFAGLQETVERVAVTRGLARWAP